jgi:hypothetical protein
MRHLLIAAAVAGTSLTAIRLADAKPIWLECGSQVINLDSAKERFSLTSGDKIYQGRATFNPGQIDFEYQWYESPLGGVGAKFAYSIDRKSLNYIKTSLQRIVIVGFSDSGWEPQSGSIKYPNPKLSKCFIMKTPPTSGNQI